MFISLQLQSKMKYNLAEVFFLSFFLIVLILLFEIDQKSHWKWSLEMIGEIYRQKIFFLGKFTFDIRRTYLLRNSGLEIFFTDNSSVFLNFPSDQNSKFLSKLIGLHPPNMGEFILHLFIHGC
jgi:hypothetical protein